MDEVIIDDLSLPLYCRRILDGIQLWHNLSIHPPLPNDWYYESTKNIDV